MVTYTCNKSMDREGSGHLWEDGSRVGFGEFLNYVIKKKESRKANMVKH